MTFSPAQEALLNAPLDRAHVASRTQSGRSLSYVEGWHCIAEANRIFGPGNWHRETLEMRLVAEGPRKIGRDPNHKDGFGVSHISKCRVTVFAGEHKGIIREGYGTGHGIDVDLGLAHESAAKEAETDGMKRALMTFGNPFGLALYDKSQANVVDTPAKPPPPQVDPADYMRRWQSMLSVTDTLAALEKLKADTVADRAAVKLADPDMSARINAAYTAKKAALANADPLPITFAA